MPYFDTLFCYSLHIMPAHAGFFTKTLTQSLSAVKLMASPQGTTVEELVRHLSLTRRSVFRLLRTIEHDLHIPVIVNRQIFGGYASYHLPPSFISKLSNIILPETPLTFDQALWVYLLFYSNTAFDDKAIHENLTTLRDKMRLLYKSHDRVEKGEKNDEI